MKKAEASSDEARAAIAAHTSNSSQAFVQERQATTLEVAPNESIQAVVDKALPGDRIEIAYGTYHERVVVDMNGISLIGVPNEAGELPILDGQGKLSEAVISSGSDFEVGYLQVQNYQNNGILVEGATNVHMHNILAIDTGIYGLYPVQSTNVLIEDSEVTGSSDAGIYAGQSSDVTIRNNKAYGNVLGIEAENTVNTAIYNNESYDNVLGILVVLLPNLTSKVSKDTVVYDNNVYDNNIDNFGHVGIAASVMSGIGIASIGADDVVIRNNRVTGNKTVGITVMHTNVTVDPSRINVPSTPENNWIYDNDIDNNGFDPAPALKGLGLPGADLIWDISGEKIYFDQAGVSSFPPVLPNSSWPDFAYRSYWNFFQLLLRLAG